MKVGGDNRSAAFASIENQNQASSKWDFCSLLGLCLQNTIYALFSILRAPNTKAICSRKMGRRQELNKNRNKKTNEHASIAEHTHERFTAHNNEIFLHDGEIVHTHTHPSNNKKKDGPFTFVFDPSLNTQSQRNSLRKTHVALPSSASNIRLSPLACLRKEVHGNIKNALGFADCQAKLHKTIFEHENWKQTPWATQVALLKQGWSHKGLKPEMPSPNNSMS